MHTAFLWLSLAFGLCDAQRVAETDERAGFSPAHEQWRVLAAPEPRRLARSGWLRAMEEAALVPARRRPPAR